MIKEQNFGVEIEMTGVTREEAAKIIAEYYSGRAYYAGTYYKTWAATDRKGRIWKAMSDASINTEKKINGRRVSASHDYSCEVVTPILQYDDIEDLQNIVRALVASGAITNRSCGIHVHVDGKNHTPESLTRLINFFTGRQDLFYEALEIGGRADTWCHKISPNLLKAMKASNKTKAAMESVWYSRANDGYTGGIDHHHYNTTRYHGINLHAFFTKGTIEFRLFNGTLHAGKIKAYIQFCLAMSAWAIECRKDRLFFKSCSGYTQEQKYTLMMNVLVHRLSLRGKEFSTCRKHMTSAFKTSQESSIVA